ncbi:helix-turn-helix domain-containing protein [Verminephrobacter eiseniae]|nr:helix-turn-helix domain-containing protein [Verminephrobacter eiseniae]
MELRQQANGRAVRADLARRARLILLLAEGLTWSAIRAKLDCNDSYIALWSKRFAADRLAGLFSRLPVASATRSPTALRRVCWRARPSTSPPMVPRTGPRASSLPNLVATFRT